MEVKAAKAKAHAPSWKERLGKGIKEMGKDMAKGMSSSPRRIGSGGSGVRRRMAETHLVTPPPYRPIVSPPRYKPQFGGMGQQQVKKKRKKQKKKGITITINK